LLFFIFRDIKCANILVHANGSVKLADFGLAKEMSKINMLRSCKGSVYWMAPEVVNPKKTYGPQADIWSLGCTVLEMLTRNIPYPNVEWVCHTLTLKFIVLLMLFLCVSPCLITTLNLCQFSFYVLY
jgi:serine/threonine protein kinase